MGYWGLQKPHLVLTGQLSAQQFETGSSPSQTFSQQVSSEELAQGDGIAQTDTSTPADHQVKEKYNHSTLDDGTAGAISEAIDAALSGDQLFLDAGLNLTTFATHLGIRKHLVSQVINQTMNSSFFQLINHHRVAYAKLLIDAAQQQFTLERIAVESGFNNRVTFNKAFKEVEGCSPSVYRKTLKMAS